MIKKKKNINENQLNENYLLFEFDKDENIKLN